MSDSDAQSLTLPKPGSLSRVRRRRWKRPPNWKRLLGMLAFDVFFCVVNIYFFSRGYVFNGIAAVGFVAGITITVRRLFREDGGIRPHEDGPYTVLGLVTWLTCIAGIIVHVVF